MASSAQVTTQTFTRPTQTAGELQSSIMTLHRWLNRDDFPQPLKRGQVVLYDVAAIASWLAGEVA